MPAHQTPTPLRAVLDGPLGARRVEIVALCMAVAITDGFDIQAAAFVAPILTREWDMGALEMGWILTAGIAGLMLGTMLLGPMSDRVGRRAVLIGSVFAFAACSLGTATSQSATVLMAWRLLTGLGLGGALIAALSIAAEIAPQRMRATLIIVMFIGFPLGGSLGGLLAVPLTQSWGWQGVFLVGGLLPALLGAILCLRMPESPSYLIAARADPSRIAALLRRIAPSRPAATTEVFVLDEAAPPSGSTLMQLFGDGRARGTLLLWGIAFLTMMVSYLLIAWLPTIMRGRGLPLSEAIYVAVTFNLGGVAGALVLARCVDRLGPGRPLAVAYLLAAAVIWLAAQSSSLGATFGLTALAGACVIGSQFCVTAVATSFYPTPIRATGGGWALGVGRIGALAGPLLGGLALSAGWNGAEILSVSFVPPALCALLIALLAHEMKARAPY